MTKLTNLMTPPLPTLLSICSTARKHSAAGVLERPGYAVVVSTLYYPLWQMRNDLRASPLDESVYIQRPQPRHKYFRLVIPIQPETP